MRVKGESEKVGLKLNIPKIKILVPWKESYDKSRPKKKGHHFADKGL